MYYFIAQDICALAKIVRASASNNKNNNFLLEAFPLAPVLVYARFTMVVQSCMSKLAEAL